jgi:hypothetical protein
MQMPASNATPARCGDLVPVDEVVDAVEADEADENQIDGNDEIQKPRHDQNQYAGNERDERRDMGTGDNHGLSLGSGGKIGFCGDDLTDRTAARNSNTRQHDNARARVRF